jgi:hypothetical protein
MLDLLGKKKQVSTQIPGSGQGLLGCGRTPNGRGSGLFYLLQVQACKFIARQFCLHLFSISTSPLQISF